MKSWPNHPHHAQMLGISTVYQEINLCPNLSVAENILLGREPRWAGSIDWRRLNARAAQILEWLEVDIDVRQSVGMYSVAIQQMVAISRALEISARVLILDEPTSSLAVHETEKLFAVMRKLKSEGIGIIFITHFLDQVYEVSDRITVLRNGKLVGAYDTGHLATRRTCRPHDRPRSERVAGDGPVQAGCCRLRTGAELSYRPRISGASVPSSHLTSTCTKAKSSGWPACWVPDARRRQTCSLASTSPTRAHCPSRVRR